MLGLRRAACAVLGVIAWAAVSMSFGRAVAGLLARMMGVEFVDRY